MIHGAVLQETGTQFTVWAPASNSVEVMIENRSLSLALEKQTDGSWAGFVEGVAAGDLYRFRLDGGSPLPDPASRFQPQGVHGPSQVIDPFQYKWSDHDWKGIDLSETVIYELHIGTFTPEGTFTAAKERLRYLIELGVTAVELMPVADFPGDRNWGYDGVALFAPARHYGSPDDMRSLVDAAHAHGLAVILDVVYNHFGPDGAYIFAYSPFYFTKRHKTPWGDAVNLDGEYSRPVRDFFIQNALHWLKEYHIDGLRLDATHALIDESEEHFLAELSRRVQNENKDRKKLLIAEDSRNLSKIISPAQTGGWGMDAVWSDDFHHAMRRLLAGDHEGYFRDFQGNVQEVAKIIRNGWLYSGQYSDYFGCNRGTDSSGLEPSQFVFFLQNHDQVGNRAFGERLHHQITPEAYRATSTLLLLAPQTPLLFMGQEWACKTPFCFFTDHHDELGKLVTQGRREEFKQFSAFNSAASRDKIPDPQQRSTFERSRLEWTELQQNSHASFLRLYKSLLKLRKQFLQDSKPEVSLVNENALLLAGKRFVLIVQLVGSGKVFLENPVGKNYSIALDTEDPQFTPEPKTPLIETHQNCLAIQFHRPGALLIQL